MSKPLNNSSTKKAPPAQASMLLQSTMTKRSGAGYTKRGGKGTTKGYTTTGTATNQNHDWQKVRNANGEEVPIYVKPDPMNKQKEETKENASQPGTSQIDNNKSSQMDPNQSAVKQPGGVDMSLESGMQTSQSIHS